MKYIIILIFCLSFGKLAIASDIKLIIDGIDVNKGKIHIGLFDEQEKFPHREPKVGKILISENLNLEVNFTDLPNGNYAIAIFQDTNSNGILDKNFFGIPKEKYGFSGKKTFGEPDFTNAMFTLKTDVKELLINID